MLLRGGWELEGVSVCRNVAVWAPVWESLCAGRVLVGRGGSVSMWSRGVLGEGMSPADLT